ncbi:MAG: hypothetical protein H0U79_08900 [Solirubrobacterales bacterium]|nr:hypothetical protein [Solirubrobacterales bacterium]
MSLLPSPLEQVVVLRALNGLGDLLCAIPALRALRSGAPDARVTLVALPWARELIERFEGLVDEVVAFPGFPGLPEVTVDARRTTAFLASMHDRGPDLAVQLQGSGLTSNAFVALLGARAAAGFRPPGVSWSPDPERFLPWEEREHEVRRGLRLLEHLGIPSRGEEIDLPVVAEEAAAAAVLLPADAEHGYVVVHPGASEPARRWEPCRFAAVADGLADRGLVPVLTGTVSEGGPIGAVAAAMRAAPVDLGGRTTLGVLAALVRNARLVVSGDTGVSHLAAAVAAPSVVVFQASDPSRWAPLDRARHRSLGWPTGGEGEPLLHPDVSVAEVLAVAEDVLRDGSPSRHGRPRRGGSATCHPGRDAACG